MHPTKTFADTVPFSEAARVPFRCRRGQFNMTSNAPFAAMLSVLCGMAVIGFVDNFVVVIANEAGLWQFHVTRTLMALPMILALSLIGFGTIRPKRIWPVAVRSTLVAGAMMLYFGALAFLPIAEVAAGLFTSPIFVVLISAIVLRVRIGPVRIAAAISGFGGVLMVLRPEAGSFSWVTVVPVLAGLLYAIGAIATRRWCADESTLAVLGGFFVVLGLLGAAGSTFLAAFPHEAAEGAGGFIQRGWTAPTRAFLFWTLVQAAGSIVAVGLLIWGYQRADASFVSIFEYSLLLWVSIWAYILRGETIDAPAAIGMGLIIVSGAVIALRSRRGDPVLATS